MGFTRVAQTWTRTTAITCKRCGAIVWSASALAKGPKPKDPIFRKPVGECKDCFSKSKSFLAPAGFGQVDDNCHVNLDYEDWAERSEHEEQFGW